MRYRGSNEEIDMEAAGSYRPRLFARLWRRLRGEREPAAPHRAWLWSRRPADDSGGPSFAAPRTTAQPVRHVAQASGGPFVETRLAREVRRLVSSLGESRGDVALTLERHRVRAEPGGRGPAAHYLEAVIGADPNVKSVVVDQDAVTVELRAWWRSSVTVKLPSVVAEFNVAFDAGCYPRLLEAQAQAEAEADRE